jgi:hypothetical protein
MRSIKVQVKPAVPESAKDTFSTRRTEARFAPRGARVRRDPAAGFARRRG